MKPAKKKERQKDFVSNDELVKKPVKKNQLKRDRKLSIYDPLDEEEDTAEMDLFDYDIDAIDEENEDDYWLIPLQEDKYQPQPLLWFSFDHNLYSCK